MGMGMTCKNRGQLGYHLCVCSQWDVGVVGHAQSWAHLFDQVLFPSGLLSSAGLVASCAVIRQGSATTSLEVSSLRNYGEIYA